MTAANCPICAATLAEDPGHDPMGHIQHRCPRCGQFSLTMDARIDIKTEAATPTLAGILSHAIRRMQKLNRRPLIDSKMVGQILKSSRLPSPAEQADNLILYLGENLEAPGHEIILDPLQHRAIMGAATDQGFQFVVEHLIEDRLVQGVVMQGTGRLTLSFEGWRQFELLRRGAVDSRKAFMAMPFDDALLDRVFERHFKAAVRNAGFELFRLNEKPKAGSIDDRLRVEIRTSRFLVAELTFGNQGVYWEAGFAEGLGKPVIYTCERTHFEKNHTHFDTNHLHTVIWKEADLEKAAAELTITIRATLPDEAKMTDD